MKGIVTMSGGFISKNTQSSTRPVHKACWAEASFGCLTLETFSMSHKAAPSAEA